MRLNVELDGHLNLPKLVKNAQVVRACVFLSTLTSDQEQWKMLCKWKYLWQYLCFFFLYGPSTFYPQSSTLYLDPQHFTFDPQPSTFDKNPNSFFTSFVCEKMKHIQYCLLYICLSMYVCACARGPCVYRE